MSKPKIIIVDDDADFRAPIAAILANEGLLVKEAASAEEMDTLLNDFHADMLLLDVNLPGENGLSIVRRIKKRRAIDVVMLSAMGEVEHRVDGLSSGADYYLPKPVDMRELLAVIHNRFITSPMIQVNQQPQWILDTKQWLLTTPDGVPHSLSHNELAILTALVKQSRLGQATTKEMLYKAVGKPSYEPTSRSIDLHISRLRQRFSQENYKFPVKTLRNIGYELTEAAGLI